MLNSLISLLSIFDAYLWLLSTHDTMQISTGSLSPTMCARVKIVLCMVKQFLVLFIELKKEKKSLLSLFSIFVHKVYYFVSYLAVGIILLITVAYEKFNTTEKKVKYAFF